MSGDQTTNQLLKRLNISTDALKALDDLDNVELGFIDGVTAGTALADKALVINSSKGITGITSMTIATMTAPIMAGAVTFADGTTDIDFASHDGTNGVKLGGVLLTAGAAELNAVADKSGSLISLTGTVAITLALHAERTMLITGTSAAAYTLPEATGTGNVYYFVINEVHTNGTTFVAADTSNTSYRGILNSLDEDGTAVTAFSSSSGDDTVTWNGTTTGGAIGDWIEFRDVATDLWFVKGQMSIPAGSNPADPWSSAA